MTSESSHSPVAKIASLDLLKDLPEEFEPEAYDALHNLEQRINQADHIIIGLGGRHNRLGETIVETGPAIEGLLRGLDKKGKRGTKVTIVVDTPIRSLFSEQAYREAFWSNIEIIASNPTRRDNDYSYIDVVAQQSPGKSVVVFDFNGSNLANTIDIEEEQILDKKITYVHNLHSTSIHDYTSYGNKRYATFIQDLLRLDEPLDTNSVQPTIRLDSKDYVRLPLLLERYHLQKDALLIICGFQASEGAKCYGKWFEVMTRLAEYIYDSYPNQKVQFLIACGPNDETQPEGFSSNDLRQQFGYFTGINNNAAVVVESGIPLRDLAILASSKAAEDNGHPKPIGLSNDSLLSHLVGAVNTPVVTPYLPHYWPKSVWASTPYHHGVTLPDNLINNALIQVSADKRSGKVDYNDVTEAIRNGSSTVINMIGPQVLAEEAIKCLQI